MAVLKVESSLFIILRLIMIIVVNVSGLLYRKQRVFVYILQLRLTKSDSFIQRGIVSPW